MRAPQGRYSRALALAVVAMLLSGPALAENIDPDNDDTQYAKPAPAECSRPP